MLSAILAATTIVLGAGLLALAWFTLRAPPKKRRGSGESQKPFRELVESIILRLADVEGRTAALPNIVEQFKKEAHNAAQRADYHASRAQKVVDEFKAELDELLQGDEGGGSDASGSPEQGVLPLRAGVASVSGNTQRPGSRVDPWAVARMNGA